MFSAPWLFPALSWWDGFGKSRINGIFFEAINELGIQCSRALRLSRLITYHSHTRSKALMSFGISRSEALSGYQPSSEPRPQKFSSGLRAKVEQIAQQYGIGQMVFKFRLHLE
jgi:hypothetical protein